MSDGRQVHRAVQTALKQLYPEEPRGNLARHLNTLVGLVVGIVLSKCLDNLFGRSSPDTPPAQAHSSD